MTHEAQRILCQASSRSPAPASLCQSQGCYEKARPEGGIQRGADEGADARVHAPLRRQRGDRVSLLLQPLEDGQVEVEAAPRVDGQLVFHQRPQLLVVT